MYKESVPIYRFVFSESLAVFFLCRQPEKVSNKPCLPQPLWHRLLSKSRSVDAETLMVWAQRSWSWLQSESPSCIPTTYSFREGDRFHERSCISYSEHGGPRPSYQFTSTRTMKVSYSELLSRLHLENSKQRDGPWHR